MPRKLTHEEFVKRVFEKVGNEYTVLSEYKGALEEVWMRHNNEKCDYHKFPVTPNSFLNQGTRCPECFGNIKKTTEQFKKEVFERVGNEYTVLSEYKNNRTEVWMRHNSEKCDYYEFPVRPDNFLGSKNKKGTRCPKCSGLMKKTTDQFKKEVFEKVGNEYTVLSEYKNNHTEVWFRHNNESCDNHEFPMTPHNFLDNGQRCPKCAGNMKKTTEQFKKEVYELVGDEYEVLGEYNNANTPIWMKHNLCGYKFPVRPNKFKRGSRCPKCSGRVWKDTEYFKNEVFELVGDEYQVLGEYIDAHTEILLKHNNESCNYHEFQMTPSNFLQGQRCPKCSDSKGEKEISRVLDKLNIAYKEQYKFDDCRNKKPLPFDFAIFDNNNNLIALIEYQGEQHYEPIEFFGGEEHFTYVRNNDLIKKKYCEEKNIKLIEIPYWQFDNIEDIILQHFSDLIKTKTPISA